MKKLSELFVTEGRGNFEQMISQHASKIDNSHLVLKLEELAKAIDDHTWEIQMDDIDLDMLFDAWEGLLQALYH